MRTLGSAAEIQWLGDDWGLVLYQAWSRMLTAGDTYHPFLYVKAAGIARKFPLPELKSVPRDGMRFANAPFQKLEKRG